MTEEAGARLRAAYGGALNPSSQRSVDAALRQHEADLLRQDLTPRERLELGEVTERRQILVSQHNNRADPDDGNGHPGLVPVSGCPYCYPPGRLGDYAAPGWLRSLWSATAQDVADAYSDAADDERPS